jgi:NAD(P)-dependent dehydrogenase (short-subunit alcohol dehydrogenase family)
VTLAGKVALVTGAAGGIGRSTALRLAELGAAVAAVDVDGAGAKSTADEVAALGGRSIAVEADLASADAAETAVERCVTELGRIDILVNNAGTGTREPFPDVTVESWDRVHAVNLRAPFLLIQAAARHMIEQGQGGKVVNVSSASGFRATMTHPVYSSSKAGLDGLTRSVAAALGPHDINVNAVAPGLTATRMGHRLGDDAALQAAVEDGPLANLLRRFSTPEDVAGVIVWLCTPEAAQLTGQTIHTSAGNVV